MVDLLRTDPRAAWSVALFMACALVILGGGIGAALAAWGLSILRGARRMSVEAAREWRAAVIANAQATALAARAARLVQDAERLEKPGYGSGNTERRDGTG